MSAPAHVDEAAATIELRALPEYEPARRPTPVELDEEPGFPDRWSSLRPERGPQLVVEHPATGEDEPSTATLRRTLCSVLEVLDGRRHVGQLRTLLAGPAYEAMLTRLRTAPHGRRHRLRRIRTCRPATDIVELAAVIEVTGARRPAPRVVAAALRWERQRGGWRCTVLRLL
jgi:Family of unknown function (DUF6459)